MGWGKCPRDHNIHVMTAGSMAAANADARRQSRLSARVRGTETRSAMPAVLDRYANEASNPAATAHFIPGLEAAKNVANTRQVKKTSENVVHPNRIR
jgi:hypothetical protein